MKRFLALISAILLLITPAAALAKGSGGPVYVPPSQSAASQYTEDVPTAGGNTATKSVHHATPAAAGTSHSGGSGGASGGSSGSGGSSSGGSIPGSTLSAMSSAGSTGAAAASIAQALAPAEVKHAPQAGDARHITVQAKPSSASGQVVDTLTGSDAGSGVGVLLPIILIGSLVVATVAGISRFRRPGTAS